MPNNNFDDPNSFFDRVLTGSSNQAQFWSRRSFWGSILMTVAILMLVSVVWLSYIGAPEVSREEQLPLLSSDTQNVRTRPEAPGGREIPNRDSTVYNALREDGPSVPKVENLLAGRDDNDVVNRDEFVEEPVDLNDPDAVREAMLRKAEEHARALQEKAIADSGLPTRGEFPEPDPSDTTPEETLEYVRSVLDREEVKTIHPVEDAPKQEVVETPKVSPKPVVKPVAEQKAEPKAEPKPVTAAPSTTSGTGPSKYVQLGSFKSQAAAQDQWAKMKKDFPSVLGGLTLRVQKADLGAKGVYYRVQAGSVPESTAKEICAQINAKRSGSCITVKP